jgi:hypothetical protein
VLSIIPCHFLFVCEDEDTINTRLDVVSELIRDEDTFFNLQAVLSRFPDVDHLISACVQVPLNAIYET